VQTAAKSGIPASLVHTIFNELLEAEEPEVRKVVNNLPAEFPQELVQSIVGGLRGS
jgi:hypothetical protein